MGMTFEDQMMVLCKSFSIFEGNCGSNEPYKSLVWDLIWNIMIQKKKEIWFSLFREFDERWVNIYSLISWKEEKELKCVRALQKNL